MDIHEEIEQKRILKKPDNVQISNVNHENKATKSDKKRKVKSYAKNEHLYESLDSDISELDSPEPGTMKTVNDIRSQLLELNGGNNFSDHVIFAKWQKDVDMNGDNDAISKSRNPFKRNALMRSIVNQKNNTMLRVETKSSNFTSGKKKENIDVNDAEEVEGGYLIQSTEDSDFYFLRDTTKRDKIDDHKFEFRGIKKTTTPRSFAIFETSTQDFVFTKKSFMVKTPTYIKSSYRSSYFFTTSI